MRSLSSNGGTGCEVQPLTTDLSQGIGTSLGGGSLVFLSRSSLGVHHGSERRQQDLAGLRIKVPVHPHHACEGGGGVQAPTCPELRLGVCTGLCGDRLAPVPHDPGEPGDRVHAGAPAPARPRIARRRVDHSSGPGRASRPRPGRPRLPRVLSVSRACARALVRWPPIGVLLRRRPGGSMPSRRPPRGGRLAREPFGVRGRGADGDCSASSASMPRRISCELLLGLRIRQLRERLGAQRSMVDASSHMMPPRHEALDARDPRASETRRHSSCFRLTRSQRAPATSSASVSSSSPSERSASSILD